MSSKFSFPDPKRDVKSDLTIDTDQLEAFAAGAKEHKGGHPGISTIPKRFLSTTSQYG